MLQLTDLSPPKFLKKPAKNSPFTLSMEHLIHRLYGVDAHGDIGFHLLQSTLPFRDLSVTFMHCAQMAQNIDMISFAYYSPMSLQDRIKIWLTSNFTPK